MLTVTFEAWISTDMHTQSNKLRKGQVAWAAKHWAFFLSDSGLQWGSHYQTIWNVLRLWIVQGFGTFHPFFTMLPTVYKAKALIQVCWLWNKNKSLWLQYATLHTKCLFLVVTMNRWHICVCLLIHPDKKNTELFQVQTPNTPRKWGVVDRIALTFSSWSKRKCTACFQNPLSLPRWSHQNKICIFGT